MMVCQTLYFKRTSFVFPDKKEKKRSETGEKQRQVERQNKCMLDTAGQSRCTYQGGLANTLLIKDINSLRKKDNKDIETSRERQVIFKLDTAGQSRCT